MPASELSAGRGEHTLLLTALLIAIHAAAFSLSFMLEPLWPLAFCSLAPLAWATIKASSTRRAVGLTFLMQVPMWLWIQGWMIDVTFAGYIAFALYLSMYPTLFVWLLRRVDTRLRCRAPISIVVPVLWCGVECLRGELLFDGYPWYLLAHPTIEWPLFAQSADIGGVYLLSFLIAMFNGLLVDGGLWLTGAAKSRTTAIAGATVAVLLGAHFGYGACRMSQSSVLSDGPTVLVIQTNLPQDNKIGWTKEQQEQDVPAFIELTRDAFASTQTTVDLIAWPETMLPGIGLEPDTNALLAQFGEANQHLRKWGDALVALSRELDTPILTGSGALVEGRIVQVDETRYRLESEYEYNSAYLIDGEPPFQRYDKTFLTPFGETMPYISNWPWLQDRLLALGARGMEFTLDKSKEIRRLRFTAQDGREIRIATPICFEDTVAPVCRTMAWQDGRKAIEAFVNLSNDGWFGSSHAGRRQHAQIARFRAIENRVPLVRVANTGLSIHVDSSGKLVGQIGEGRYGHSRVSGFLVVDLTLDSRAPLFAMAGNLWAWICLIGTVGLGIWTCRKHRA